MIPGCCVHHEELCPEQSITHISPSLPGCCEVLRMLPGPYKVLGMVAVARSSSCATPSPLAQPPR